MTSRALAKNQQLQRALAHQHSGELVEAERLLRNILNQAPKHPAANFNVGLLALHVGRPDASLPYLKTALEADLECGEYWMSYVSALIASGNAIDAKLVLDQGMRLGLSGPEVDRLRLKTEQAIAATPLKSHAKTVQVSAKDELKLAQVITTSDLFSIASQQYLAGRLSEVEVTCRQSLVLDPDHAESLHLLGIVAYQTGRNELAVDMIEKAIKFDSGRASFHCNLGNALMSGGRVEQSITCFEKALSLQPGTVEFQYNLGNALLKAGRVVDAIACFEQLLSAKPDHVLAMHNLGVAFRGFGEIDRAIECFRSAQDSDPEYQAARVNLLLTMQYSASFTPENIFAEHRRWANSLEGTLAGHWPLHENRPDPAKRLKVGYVSADFRDHPVYYFIEPILAQHNSDLVEVYCYYSNTLHDAQTDRIRQLADHWLVCASLTDQQLADRIQIDGIDILVDLSGHTAGERLPVFARKPAPIQATWIGYPGSTGLKAIDYRITDEYMDPPGLTEQFHSETLIRLPGTNAAYRPVASCPPVNSLPALSGQAFTFASLNNPMKLNQTVVSLWSKILHALPSARLMLGNVQGADLRQRFVAMFEAKGVSADRLILKPTMPLLDYLALHHQIDVALDTFPFNGGTTSMHSLWMGVPVITLVGARSVSRVGASVLARAGLTEYITESEDEYLRLALKVARDLSVLSQLRASLRDRMRRQDLDASQVAQHLEEAYRKMWAQWCAHPRALPKAQAV